MLLNFSQNVKGLAVIVVFLNIAFWACTSKKGCTDPASANFDAEAGIDDGSCIYPGPTMEATRISKLEDLFEENSGLEYVNDLLWTIVDGGGENKIYSINYAAGTQLSEIEIQGATNIDFEAIASGGGYFYVGDIGNNQGDRTDLVIYKVLFPESATQNITVTPERIEFNYPEQLEAEADPATNFDAEALLFHQNKLYLFTKNHGDQHTVFYEIPTAAGNYQAQARGRLDVEMLVSDAAINEQGNKVVLLGYNSSRVYLWLLTDFQEDKFFTGRKFKIDLGPIDSIGQAEGVAFFNENSVLISNEQEQGVDPSVYYLDLSGIE